jgi:lantibiotic biosynthesis protein
VQALAEGTLGMALLHIERGDLAAARDLLEDAVAGGVSTGANASLYHGAPAVEFVVSRAGRTDRTLQEATDKVVAARLAAAARRRDSARFPDPAEFDLIRGLTGLGAVLLSRPGTQPLARQVLAYLVSLAHPAGAGGPDLPGWWTTGSPGHQKLAGGCSDNGVAHGIAGALALLAIAAGGGVQVAGQAEAIEALARWLERYGGYYWTTLDQLSAPRLPPAPAARPSWCYGTLGITRTLQLAGIALRDPARAQDAENTALAALRDPARLSLITDASLCHGWAGLLTITRAIAADSPGPGRFTATIRELRAQLAGGITALPKPGFLEGQAGAQLALDGTSRTGWTRALLAS